MRSARLRLEDMAYRAKKLSEIAERFTEEQFYADEDAYELALRHIEILGEASKYLPADLLEQFPDLPWKEIRRTRDIVAHGYFILKREIIWHVVTVDSIEVAKIIPDMLSALEK